MSLSRGAYFQRRSGHPRRKRAGGHPKSQPSYRDVSCPRVAALESAAREKGVEVLILDGAGSISRIHAFMAARPEAVLSWSKRHRPQLSTKALATGLSPVRAQSGFAEVMGPITRKLSGSLLGYDDTRRRIHDKLRAALASDALMAALFGQRAAVRQPERQIVRRKEVDRNPSDWWAQRDVEHAALVGEEGTGKTWALLDWIAGRLEDLSLLPFRALSQTVTEPPTLRADPWSAS